MVAKLRLLKILLNPCRRQILEQINKVDTAVAVLERMLGISHGYLWRNINLLKKNKLIILYPYPLKDHHKPKDYIGGRPYSVMVAPHLEKNTYNQIIEELEEIKNLIKITYTESPKRKKVINKKSLS